jgi:transcription termination factor Rho
MIKDPQTSEPAPAGDSLSDQDLEQAGGSSAVPPKVEPELPARISLNELQLLTALELYAMCSHYGIRVPTGKGKRELVYEICCWMNRRSVGVWVEGVIDFPPEPFGLIRYPALSYQPGMDDVFVAGNLMKKFELKQGQKIAGWVKSAKDRDKYMSLEALVEIEGKPLEEWEPSLDFERLVAMFPDERIHLETIENPAISCRVVDIVAPLGKGQRGLIVAAPRSGKTILLKDMAKAITRNHKEMVVLVVLVDERPEEVTDFKESVPAEVFSSTFDQPPHRHIQLAELVLERAKRLVEMGKDVIIMLDSLTRLARGYNNLKGGSGRLMSGGMDSKALIKPKKFFGAARNIEDGGSLTILATALVETESQMDVVIFEEFKGTGNMEIHLDRELAEKRVYPAIHPSKSGTRKDDLLYHEDEWKRVSVIRRQMAQLPAGEAMEVLIENIQNTKSNTELLLRGLKT